MVVTAPAQSLTTLRTNGSSAKRLNIVFLSEGYTVTELPQFTNDARTVLDKLLTTPPFNDYSNYFNAFAIPVASVESGSDHPSRSSYRNTYFNSTYDSYGIARLVTIPPNDRDSTYANGQGKVYDLLAQLMPEYDIVALIVNDTEYGGSGGFPLVTSVNSSAPEIAVHEMGHSFSALGDEYESPYPGYPDIEEPNTTRETNRSLIKWRAWIDGTTPVPTPATAPYNSVIGLFQGAHFNSTGWFRPKLDCKMRTLGVPFCEVCTETLVKSIYGTIRPIESFTPSTAPTINLTNINSVAFTLTLPMPAPPTLHVQWFTNNVAVSGATSVVFNVDGFSFPPGTNQLRVEVADATTRVRNDATILLKDSRTWTIQSTIIQPVLQISAAVNRVSIAWQTVASGYQLESSTLLGSSLAWTSVTNTPTVVSNQNNVTLDATSPTRFFQMRRP
jgi:hypothetical protein